MAKVKKTLQEKLETRKITRPNFIYNLLGGLWKLIYLKKLNVHVDYKIDLKKEKLPFIVVSNHASRVDYVYTGLPLLPKRLNFVCGYNEFFRSHLQGVFKILKIIPKRNFVPDIHTIKEIKRIINSGGGVVIYPEGMSSISGANQPVAVGSAKLLKHLHVPVLYSKIAGGYLTNTKYCLDERKGKVEVEFGKLFTVEDLDNLSEEEITKILNTFLYHDDYAWNKEKRIKFDGHGEMAKNMHTLLYWCPNCKQEFTMHGEFNKLTCRHCQMEIEVNEYYDLICSNPEIKLPDTPKVWYDMQRDLVREQIKNPDFELKEIVKLGILPSDKYLKNQETSMIVGEGVITLNHKGFTFEGTKESKPFSFYIDSSNLATYGMCTDVTRFYTFVDKEFYEFYPSTPCVAKWFLATEEIHRLMGGKWQDFE